MRTVLSDARRGHPGLHGFAVAMAGLAVVLLVLLVVDQRTLAGAPLWAKPLKFAISLALYSATLAWLLSRLPRPGLRVTGWVVAAAGLIEIILIAGQAARGRLSHFNSDGLENSLLFALMGLTIAVLYFATIAVAVRFLRERGLGRVEARAVRLGLLVTLLGLSVGYVMVANGAHAVGVPDGGAGLPFTGWSTTGGDLRIAHFAGLHALQLLPLLALLLRSRLGEGAQLRVVTAAGAGLAALVGLLTWQALRAQPLLAPDGLTLAALTVVVLGTGAAVASAVRDDRVARTGPGVPAVSR